MSNLATSLRRRRRGPAMAGHDRLPPELRRRLAEAVLSLSPCAVRRLGVRLHRDCNGDTPVIRRQLDADEARLPARDAPKTWGSACPGTGQGPLARSRQPGPGGRCPFWLWRLRGAIRAACVLPP